MNTEPFDKNEEIYLNESRLKETKEMFKFIGKRSLSPNFNGTLCDFGCATGEFLYYLQSIVPQAKLHGMDISEKLIEKAKQNIPSCTFLTASILDKCSVIPDKFDLSFMTGVLTNLMEFETAIGNLINWTKPGGSIYITEMFNPYPVTVIAKYSLDNGECANWNIFSQNAVGKFLMGNEKVTGYEFIKFKIPIDLPKQSDPVRSWTMLTEAGRIITNGLCVIEPFYLLKIQL